MYPLFFPKLLSTDNVCPLGPISIRSIISLNTFSCIPLRNFTCESPGIQQCLLITCAYAQPTMLKLLSAANLDSVNRKVFKIFSSLMRTLKRLAFAPCKFYTPKISYNQHTCRVICISKIAVLQCGNRTLDLKQFKIKIYTQNA